MNEVMAFDSGKLAAAVRAGFGRALIEELASERYGIKFAPELGQMDWFKPGLPMNNFKMAMDVQSELVTVSNAGIPSYLANFLDPRPIMILVSPLKAATIAGERGIGDWLTESAQFITVEQTGETASYGDYSQNGQSNVNANFPSRQNYLFQAFLQYGDFELGRAGLAKLDWAAQQQAANATTLMKQLNNVYFFGVGNLQNYGLINAPTLPPSITAAYAWLTSPSANANTIYQDILRMWIQMQAQTGGVVENDAKIVLAMSNEQAGALKSITQYNTNSVEQLLKQNFPNIRIETAVQYATASGQLVQMIVEDLEGQKTVEVAFSSKLMAHSMVRDTSSVKQKRSAGGYGAWWARPFLQVSMIA